MNVTECYWCSFPLEFMKAGGSSGYKITAWCHRCQRPGVKGKPFFRKGEFTEEERENMPMLQNEAKNRCPICGGYFESLETHHTAPRALFGEMADLWPTIDVCRSCHEEWHEAMGCSIGHHKRAAE